MTAMLISKQFKYHPTGVYKILSRQKIKKKKRKKAGCTGGRHVDAVVSLQVTAEEAIRRKGTSLSNKPSTAEASTTLSHLLSPSLSICKFISGNERILKGLPIRLVQFNFPFRCKRPMARHHSGSQQYTPLFTQL